MVSRSIRRIQQIRQTTISCSVENLSFRVWNFNDALSSRSKNPRASRWRCGGRSFSRRLAQRVRRIRLVPDRWIRVSRHRRVPGRRIIVPPLDTTSIYLYSDSKLRGRPRYASTVCVEGKKRTFGKSVKNPYVRCGRVFDCCAQHAAPWRKKRMDADRWREEAAEERLDRKLCTKRSRKTERSWAGGKKSSARRE